MSKDYYAMLGVGKNATEAEIKQAFRKLAHQYHPDKKGGDAEKFKQINEAYQTLGDPAKRKQFDQFGSGYEQAGFGGQGGGFNWEDIVRQSGMGGNAHGFDFGDLGDLFGSAFGFGGRGGQRASTGPQRGGDISSELVIEFEQAVRGEKRTIGYNRTEKCDHCSGNGAEPGSKINTCGNCNGSGQETRVQRTPFGQFQVRTACSKCRGEGKTYEKPCKQCDGQGVKNARAQIVLNIPAGIDDGETIRMSGEGQAGIRGGGAGDLYVRIRVRASKMFMRQGYDIVSKATINFPLAALGGSLPTETIDGTVDLDIPPGTQSGAILKIKDAGITRLHGRGKGDHLVHITVTTPSKLSKKAKQLMEELKSEL